MKKTWLLGFGFFSISLTWALYNAYVPLFLEDFIESTFIIGFLMTLDNYFALFLQPWVGNRSDRTNTRYGRRMPYLLVGMPLAAVFTMLIPTYVSLFTLVLFMVLMNLSMSLYRSPTVALMPDITPEPKRSKANGIINFMGARSAVAAFGGGAVLYDMHRTLPFAAAAILTLVALLVVFSKIKEKTRYVVLYCRGEEASSHEGGAGPHDGFFAACDFFLVFVLSSGRSFVHIVRYTASWRK